MDVAAQRLAAVPACDKMWRGQRAHSAGRRGRQNTGRWVYAVSL